MLYNNPKSLEEKLLFVITHAVAVSTFSFEVNELKRHLVI